MNIKHGFLFASILLVAISGCTLPTSPTAAPTRLPATPLPEPTPTRPPLAVPSPTTVAAQPSPIATPGPTVYPEPAIPTIEATPPTPGAYPAPEAGQPSAAGVAWVADGTISDGEYAASAKIGPMTIWWHNDAEFLYIAAEAPTNGWVSVGLDPVEKMKGANYLIAAFDGEPKIEDGFGTAPVGNAHPADTTLGGRDDIADFAVVERNGRTLFEAKIPLDSGDIYDKPLQVGQEYPIIVAYGNADEFTTPHAFRGAGNLRLQPAP